MFNSKEEYKMDNTIDLFNNKYMAITISDSHKFIFFMNHKVCITSINRILFKKNIKDILNKKFDLNSYKKWVDNSINKFDEYFKFTIVRNPWDRMVSCFSYMNYSNLKFEEFILSYIAAKEKDKNNSILSDYEFRLVSHLFPQINNIILNGKQYVDFIGRYENLNSAWNVITNKINFHHKLPHKNATIHKNYVQYYDKNTIKLVENLYLEEIEFLNYKFGEQ